MNRWRLALDRLLDALEGEILGASEPELHTIVMEDRPGSNLRFVRRLIANSVEEGEESAAPLPQARGSGPTIRRM